MRLLRSVACSLSARRLGLAGLAALVGCVACCAIPLLAAAGLGGGAAAAIAQLLHPGTALAVGGIVFVVVLATLAVRRRVGG